MLKIMNETFSFHHWIESFLNISESLHFFLLHVWHSLAYYLDKSLNIMKHHMCDDSYLKFLFEMIILFLEFLSFSFLAETLEIENTLNLFPSTNFIFKDVIQYHEGVCKPHHLCSKDFCRNGSFYFWMKTSDCTVSWIGKNTWWWCHS